MSKRKQHIERVKAFTPEQCEAYEFLRTVIKRRKNKQIVYTTVHSVSRSGMTRHMSVYVVHKGQIRCLNWWINKLTKSFPLKDGKLRVGGCGMDMGFHVVYTLARVLFEDGYAVRQERL